MPAALSECFATSKNYSTINDTISVPSLNICLVCYCNHSTYISNSSSEVELEKCITPLLKFCVLGVK